MNRGDVVLSPTLEQKHQRMSESRVGAPVKAGQCLALPASSSDPARGSLGRAMPSPREQAATFFRDLQERICQAVTEIDGGAGFREDLWQRPGGGGGRTRVLVEGGV